MQLVILHYHLSSGGVAQVVQNHLLALACSDEIPERVLLLHGGRMEGLPLEQLNKQTPFPIECLTIEGLDYDREDASATEGLAKTLTAVLSEAGALPEDTLLHWHNHSLGKNVSAPLAVRRLAALGYRTLLQIHDFAEDFRPQNYRRLSDALVNGDSELLPSLLYPQADHIFYAALNRRDYQVLHQAGVEKKKLRLLPNPVSDPPSIPDACLARQLAQDVLSLSAEEQLAVYPVRGIRRKNLGEMLLWSAVAENTSFLVTLAPQNPIERVSFDRWQKFAEDLCLPCRFATPESSSLSYEQVLAASDLLITTSVAEGFGMVFLEAWLANRCLLGRNLPEITSDFQQAGLDLSDLYSELAVPTKWVDQQLLLDSISDALKSTYQAFGVTTPTTTEIQQHLSSFLDAPNVDFARLPTRVQCEVIRRAKTNRSDRHQLQELNPKLQLSKSGKGEKLSANAAVVRENFSLAAIGKQLASVYAEVISSSPSSELTPPTYGHKVFDSFLGMDRLHAIRVES